LLGGQDALPTAVACGGMFAGAPLATCWPVPFEGVPDQAGGYILLLSSALTFPGADG